jgi:hypothetical protein
MRKLLLMILFVGLSMMVKAQTTAGSIMLGVVSIFRAVQQKLPVMICSSPVSRWFQVQAILFLIILQLV